MSSNGDLFCPNGARRAYSSGLPGEVTDTTDGRFARVGTRERVRSTYEVVNQRRPRPSGVSRPRPRLRRPQCQPGSAADPFEDECRERDDDQYDENGPQHREAPFLACLKRRIRGPGVASPPYPVADATRLCPQSLTDTNCCLGESLGGERQPAGAAWCLHLCGDGSARRPRGSRHESALLVRANRGYGLTASRHPPDALRFSPRAAPAARPRRRRPSCTGHCPGHTTPGRTAPRLPPGPRSRRRS